MGSQAKSQPLSPGASNPNNDGASTLQALQGQNANVSTIARATGGENDQSNLLQQYLSQLLSK